MKKYLILIFTSLLSFSLLAQDDEPEEERLFVISTPVDLSVDGDDADEPVRRKKQKKTKKNVFYGLKTKKGFTRRGVGERMTYERFRYLRKPVELDKYVRDIYWFDFTRKEIRRTGYDPKKGYILHGPYQKIQGEQILEEGIFFRGTKHGRWMQHDREDLLVDKQKYFKGWPKETLVGYYDPQTREKVREIIPIEYGEKDGNYFIFFENGRVAVSGEYRWNQKIGEWTEFFPNGRRKKVVRYPNEPYDKSVMPITLFEWNEQGILVYDYELFKRRALANSR
ncbi:MAG TPA: hypothetical protein PKC24_10030 [Cyclobacteriaceae bacterium]|nr:hypothetical protein [Cyclobacteriaceae bacterium]